MPSLRRNHPPVHPDETRPVEAHAQTLHKLDVMPRYFGQFPSVLIEAAKTHRKIFADDVYLVDAFAGAGLHRSADHIDGVVSGTALQACYQARRVQRKYPSSRVHVRLIDLNPNYCAKLMERTAKFRNGLDAEKVDVRVIQGDVAHKVSEVLQDTVRPGGHNFSLWFFDPYGVRGITRDTFAPLLSVGYGPEIIINLDVSGLFRIRAAAISAKAEEYEVVEAISAADRKLLNAVYDGDAWELALGSIERRGNVEALRVLADTYAATFDKAFPYHTAYPLRSSNGQVRYLVHLTKSKKAVAKFQATYKASLKTGLLQGNQLTQNDRARVSAALFEVFRGNDQTIDDMHELGVYPLNKNQLRVVMREADDLNYGTFDGTTMHWFEVRQDDVTRQIARDVEPLQQQTSLFDL